MSSSGLRKRKSQCIYTGPLKATLDAVVKLQHPEYGLQAETYCLVQF